MKANWIVDCGRYLPKKRFKCVKVYNYHAINEVVQLHSSSQENRVGENCLVGIWKIKKLKV